MDRRRELIIRIIRSIIILDARRILLHLVHESKHHRCKLVYQCRSPLGNASSWKNRLERPIPMYEWFSVAPHDCKLDEVDLVRDQLVPLDDLRSVAFSATHDSHLHVSSAVPTWSQM